MSTLSATTRHNRAYSADVLKHAASSREYDLGDWVLLSNMRHSEGIILFIGNVKGKDGTQYGIEVTDFSVGEHNGTYQGISYFQVNRFLHGLDLGFGKTTVAHSSYT